MSIDPLGIYFCPDILLNFYVKAVYPTMVGKKVFFKCISESSKFTEDIYLCPTWAELALGSHHYSLGQRFFKIHFFPSWKGEEIFINSPVKRGKKLSSVIKRIQAKQSTTKKSHWIALILILALKNFEYKN